MGKEYTGTKDKFGNKIYNGDIVMGDEEDGFGSKCIGEVFHWDDREPGSRYIKGFNGYCIRGFSRKPKHNQKKVDEYNKMFGHIAGPIKEFSHSTEWKFWLIEDGNSLTVIGRNYYHSEA